MSLFSKKLLLLPLGLLALSLSAQADVPAVFKASGEIFMKGSLDGKSLFLVYGLESAGSDIKSLANWAVDAEDFKEVGRDVYNQKHDNDFVDEAKDGYDVSKEGFKFMWQGPMKTLKNMPRHWNTSIEIANESRAKEPNATLAVLKYSGLAAVAVFEGAYYLVIETPIEFVGGLAAGVVGIPGALALQVVETVLDAGMIGVKLMVGAVGVVGAGAYSVLSTTTANIVTAVTAGGVAIFSGTKWLFYGMPRKLLSYPIKSEKITTVSIEDQMELAKAMVVYFEKQGMTVQTDLGKYESEVELFVSSEKGTIKFGLAQTIAEKGKVVVRMEVSKGYLNSVRALEPNRSKSEIKAEIEKKVETQLNEIAELLKK